jgi:hypothetical protein
MFKRWCSQQGFAHGNQLSHVLMDGGVLSVPFDKLDEFYTKYIECVRHGEKVFVVEQKTPTYNFFVDIDYKNTEALSIEEIQDICKIICDKVKRHGGKECLISVSPPKKVGSLTKTGIHLNWPGFVVNQVSAIALREHILVALYTVKKSIDWNEIIDSSVYGDIQRRSKGSGFRMPWSHKKGKHDSCDGKGCSDCHNTGKITQVAYLPVFVYKTGPLSTLLRIDQTPDKDILAMAAVRTENQDFVHVESPSRAIKEGSFTDVQTKDELHDEETKMLLEDFVRANLEGQGDAHITKLFKFKNQYLASTTSKYCENLKRSHGSNHVWFYISGDKITQKCFCRCETLRDRRNGFCKDFCGRRHILKPQIVERLYPEKEKIKQCPDIKTDNKREKSDIDYVEAKGHVERYIRSCMPKHDQVTVIKISKERQKYIATTTSNYCEVAKTNHETYTSFRIEKGKIFQDCQVCRKKGRIYALNTKSVNVLYPNKK